MGELGKVGLWVMPMREPFPDGDRYCRKVHEDFSIDNSRGGYVILSGRLELEDYKPAQACEVLGGGDEDPLR